MKRKPGRGFSTGEKFVALELAADSDLLDDPVMVTPMRDHFHTAIVPMKLMTLIVAVLIVTSVFVTITIVVAAHIGVAVIGRIRPAVIGLNGHACRLRRRNDSGGRSKCKDGSYY